MKQMFWGIANSFIGVIPFGLAVLFFYTVFQQRVSVDWFPRLCSFLSVFIWAYIATDAFWRAGHYDVYKTSETSSREYVWD